MIKDMNKKIKKFNVLDVGLVKWSVVAGVLFLITVWPALHDLIMKVHWGWYLAAMIIFMIKPLKRMYF